jgi:orotidine-5'-phosphate decarboxylase
MTAPLDPRDRLIVALDTDIGSAEAAVATLGESVSFYKIGYQLGFAGGLALAERLAGEGKQVFLDFKLHDIGNTVEKGVASLARLGATFVTVHAYPQTMRAAVAGRGDSGLRILAVTALTSYDDADIAEAGYAFPVSELVRMRAQQARAFGVDGIVCSAAEAGLVREMAGPAVSIVTPGIRSAGDETGDQKRLVTPADAILAGADYLVVGRPILGAEDPRAAAEAIVAQIANAL